MSEDLRAFIEELDKQKRERGWFSVRQRKRVRRVRRELRQGKLTLEEALKLIEPLPPPVLFKKSKYG